ncbi:MAG TPA: hypothetical protein VKY44_03050, partial [Flavobacterium sp.]|nr:hypothetical protein [Flavobacterium sp.]
IFSVDNTEICIEVLQVRELVLFCIEKQYKKGETNTKKAVIVKLLLVYLKTALRKLHNTLLASYGLTHLFDLFWHSLNLHFVQRAFISCPPGKTKA